MRPNLDPLKRVVSHYKTRNPKGALILYSFVAKKKKKQKAYLTPVSDLTTTSGNKNLDSLNFTISLSPSPSHVNKHLGKVSLQQLLLSRGPKYDKLLKDNYFTDSLPKARVATQNYKFAFHGPEV